jgi:sterol desaturase/sphingolipid hydroxylase (fatty acid hydroxylase superfamily)
VIDEANRNYGNNFIFWDAVFGTRFLPADRSSPDALGIGGLDAFPRGYLAQLAAPLRWSAIRRASEALTRSEAPSPRRGRA